MKGTSSYLSLQLHLDDDGEDDDDDDDAHDEMGSTNTNDCSLTPEETQRFERMLAQKQQQQQPLLLWRRCKILGAIGLVLMVAGALIIARTSFFTSTMSMFSRRKSHHGAGGEDSKSNQLVPPGWISLKLPSTLRVQSVYGALAMNTDGSVLAIGDPMTMMNDDGTTGTPYRGRVILLQASQEEESEEKMDPDVGLSYRTIKTLEASDDYSEFGTALALSSSNSSTLVVGIPRNIELSLPGPTVQVYVQRASAENMDHDWELVDEFPNQSRNDMTGSWVAVSDDGSCILYSAPNFQFDKTEFPNNDVVAGGRQDDQFYYPTTGAALLWHNGYQEAFLRGECTYESFGQTVSVSSAADDATDRPVVVVTRAGCYDSEEMQRTITVWEGPNTVTNLVVHDPSEDCIMGQTGTGATVSRDGNRIVVLASCLDQETYQTRQGIYTFEKDQKSQTWVELVSSKNPRTLIIDSDLVQYRMSVFAFDDDAKTLVVTVGGHQGKDLLCYKWNETTVAWQASWKVDGNAADFGIATRVALSGNGKRLAIVAYTADRSMTPNLAVYSLP